MTELHWAAPPAPRDMAGRTPPCAAHQELAVLGGKGEHLCRVCMNCGHGWTEACASHGAAPLRAPLPSAAACAVLLSLPAALACTAGSMASLLLAGTARVAAWLAIVVAVSVAGGAIYAAVARRTSSKPAEDQARKETSR
jgi:hypothetical protein